MTTYYIDGFQCPSCSEQFASQRTTSHNTFGATFYTDAYVCGPTYDPGSALVVCPKCGQMAWRDALTSLFAKRDSEWFGQPESESMPFSVSVEADHYAKAVSSAMWRTPDEEIYLRRHVWWNGNDSRRNNDVASIPFSREEQDNLRCLLTLLEGDDPNSIVMRAEIFRELGEFEACLVELQRVTSVDFSDAVSVIERLARIADSRVAVLAS